jgi:hypothetical protein
VTAATAAGGTASGAPATVTAVRASGIATASEQKGERG